MFVVLARAGVFHRLSRSETDQIKSKEMGNVLSCLMTDKGCDEEFWAKATRELGRELTPAAQVVIMTVKDMVANLHVGQWAELLAQASSAATHSAAVKRDESRLQRLVVVP